MSDLPALPVTFRPGRTRAVLLSAGIALFTAITTVGILLRLDTAERLALTLTAALLSAVPILLARPKVVAGESGVTVVNIVHRRDLAWAEILRVNLRPGDPWVFLDLSDGTSLAALGIQPGIAKQRAIEDACTLRALVEARSAVDPQRHRG